MEDRRRHQRQSAAWPIRLWLNGNTFLAGSAVDVAPGGAFFCMSWIPSGVLMVGQAYRVDVFPGTDEQFTCVGIVRHVSCRGLGLEVVEGLPADLQAREPTAASASN